jgi:hypothetical protein
MAKKKVEFNKDMIKKYIFWACTPIGLIVAVLAGLMAVGSVAESLDKAKKDLDSQKEALGRLRSEAPRHANQGTIDAIDKERESLAEIVLSAWTTMEGDQKRLNRWEGLADAAIREIESKTFLDSLSSMTLNSYLQFAQDEINKLLDKSNIRRVQQYGQRPDGQWVPLEIINILAESGSGSNVGGRAGGMSGGRTGGMSGAPSSRATMGTGGSASGGNVPGGPVMISGKVVWDKPQLNITLKDWRDRKSVV